MSSEMSAFDKSSNSICDDAWEEFDDVDAALSQV